MADMDLDEVYRVEAEELSKSLEENGKVEDDAHHRRKRDEQDGQESEAGKRQRTTGSPSDTTQNDRQSHRAEELDDEAATLVQITTADGRVLNFRKRSSNKSMSTNVSPSPQNPLTFAPCELKGENSSNECMQDSGSPANDFLSTAYSMKLAAEVEKLTETMEAKAAAEAQAVADRADGAERYAS